MAGFDSITTVVGNLTADPELRNTQGGKSVVNARIASTPRVFDRESNSFKDGEATFYNITLWEKDAENFAASASKGARVIAVGRIKTDEYTDKDNVTHRGFKLEVDEIGFSSKFATLAVTRTGGQSGQAPAAQPQQAAPAQAPVQQAPQQAAPVQQPVAVPAAPVADDDFS